MTQGKIVLVNMTDQPLQYSLGHQEVCVRVGRCFCRRGRRGMQSSSIHVPARGRTSPLDPVVARVPEIKADTGGKRPRLKIIGAKAQPKPKDKPETKGEPEGKKKKKKGGGGRPAADD